MSVDMRVILLVEDDITDKHLHPYIGSRTLRAYTCMYTTVTESINKRWTFTSTKI
jgi:hypothetical protein